MKRLIIALVLADALFAGALARAATPIINPGTPDAAIMTYVPALGRTVPVQLEYLGMVNRPDIVVFEDGSIESRARYDQAQARWRAAQTAALHPSGVSFIPTEIEATTDR